MSIKKFPMLIVVLNDGSVLIKQFKKTSDCKKEWLSAKASGLDAYYHVSPLKKKATASLQGTVQVYL